jgi:hypothetical protein
MSPRRYLGVLRAVLLLAGVGAFCWAVYFGATLPEPPPNSDGLPMGFAVAYVVVVQIGATILGHTGYALPAGIGRFRFGPLANRPAVVRAAAATGAFAALALLLLVLGWVLPDALPHAVSGTYAFTWIGAVVGAAVGVVVTVLLAVGTAAVRLWRGNPLLDGIVAD